MSRLNPSVEISIVIPAYNEEENIPQLYSVLTSVLNNLSVDWEIIVIDDGSQDGTWDIIQELHSRDDRVRGIRLSRNFGHQYAVLAGLTYSFGKAVISMDADLQHPPYVIVDMVRYWKEGYKIVNTRRTDPDDFSLAKKLSTRLFYYLFSALSGIKLEYGSADFRLLDRQVVDELLKFREHGLFLRGLVQWVGYHNITISFRASKRFRGTTKYGARKMLRFAWHAIASFSVLPLRLGILFGLFASAISLFWLVWAVITKLFFGGTVSGWASTIVMTSFLFGVLFIFVGLIGEYIARILIQVRERPLFLVSEHLGTRDSSQDVEERDIH